MTNAMNNTPISYYGGKQRMSNKIASIIDEIDHKCYVEPFCGGAAVYFAKKPSRQEVLNDANDFVYSFWHTAKFNRNELVKRLKEVGIYSEMLNNKFKKQYKAGGEGMSELDKAVCLFYLSKSSFSGAITSGFAFDTIGTNQKKLKNTINLIDKTLSRLDQSNLTVHKRDALRFLKADRCYNKRDTLFYLDPPYVGSNQGHYPGYKQEDLERLIILLERTPASFILSHYYNKKMIDTANEHGWDIIKIKTKTMASKQKDFDTNREEILIIKNNNKKMNRVNQVEDMLA